MLSHFHSFAMISEEFKGILLDAYGVFWGNNTMGLLPGAKEAMEYLVARGKCVGILSNTSQLAAKEIHKLEKHGLILGRHFHFILTSGEIAHSIFLREELPFSTPSKKFWLFGSVHPRFASHELIFQGTSYQETMNVQEADFIYISIPHIKGEDQTNREVFRQELEALKETCLPMICTNPDHLAHEGNPPQAVVRQGGIAAMYEELGGQVFYIGKPYQTAYRMAMEKFADYQIHHPSEVLMIGDTPEIDIRGARQFGMSAALVMQTGIMANRIADHGVQQALGSLSPLDIPHFFIERLSYVF